MIRGVLGRLAAWHLPGGPVCPAAMWTSTSNVEGGSGTAEEGPRGEVSSRINYLDGLRVLVTPLLVGPFRLISQRRFEKRSTATNLAPYH